MSDIVGQPSNGTDDDMGGAGGFDNAINGGGGVAATGGKAQGGAGGNSNVAGGGQGGDAATGGSTGMPGSGGVTPGPPGSVEMFVAVGFGGRRLMSCDRGRTWIAEQIVAPVSQDNEHQSYTPKGLAYGDGTFIFLSGWGTTSTTWATSDGVTWSQRKHDNGFVGIGFDKGAFIAVGGSVAKSTDKGATWTRLNVPATSLTRDGAAFDGVWASGADAQAATLRAGGTRWVPLSGCNGPRHGGIGTAGGFVAGLGLMVSVGENGDTCGVNIATGAALSPGKIPAVIRGKPTFVGDALWVASGDKLHTSTDGVRWASRALPMGVRFDVVARTASGTYAAADSLGEAFYFSDDGQRWTKSRAPSGGKLAFLLGGAGSPSKQCPLP